MNILEQKITEKMNAKTVPLTSFFLKVKRIIDA
jgi:hypothetical protein